MKLSGYYSSGEFARMAHVTLRTIRFYDKKNILKPSYVNENGARFYTDADFVRLQQILLLKYLGFSLKDICEMTIDDIDYPFLMNSLKLQKKLVQDRIEQMQLVENAIDKTVAAISNDNQVDWSNMMDLIHLTGMEQSLRTQYRNAGNITSRIDLHSEFSTNKQGWFPWVYEQCRIHMGINVLELGCGNGALWTENISKVPMVRVVMSDISEGMLRDARRNIGSEDERFEFVEFDCHNIPYAKNSFDLVIANHVLFYCKDINRVCKEVLRVLKPGGRFVCSAYSGRHMKEITELVQKFDERIVLSQEKLYESFGLDNGQDVLQKVFENVECIRYEDSIEINKADPLIEYIISCHGNQNQFLLERYAEFRTFVEKKISRTFHITKDAGLFVCRKA